MREMYSDVLLKVPLPSDGLTAGARGFLIHVPGPRPVQAGRRVEGAVPSRVLSGRMKNISTSTGVGLRAEALANQVWLPGS